MSQIIIAVVSALWLGVLTSISPCPLATNIAAVTYLSKRMTHIKAVLWSGIAYTFGRMAAYAALGFIIVNSLLGVPAVARFLQEYMNKALGPILIFAGLFLLGIVKLNIPGFSISSKKQEGLAKAGVKGSFALGVLFALSFCPISAGLFFGSLIPLSLQHKFGPLLPFIYGFGTGLPVLFFSLCIAFGAKSFDKWFHHFSRLEYYAKKVTAVIFILVGLYFVWTHIIADFLFCSFV
ncbi:MAG: sulfite exporter TauE/SafE family protein [Candidatus Aureabacteria bacterium]|nr:sulfite exporter TauE/SafE family protein [Candidatus Auribacterota bacterium]